ncbi:hypothetical protein BEWA_040540 [Theileria equi strain WA]|uniref:Uncharacterized protein n=1 Tax=Theileria equi strain WA TaxID=1537102 RepID=L1LF84_THEEQ|nr:hypothetical protein BEWA_040540 [Theileria equi strain WA]EKX74016.1 hypothetical protein BEWA_040540 [Theileria equi strain WA]|eukprot:XP_004833468.1 hypothetical protein BEWA_040540 [Theileria equi strain WA]
MSSQELVVKLASLKSIIQRNDPKFTSIQNWNQEESGLSQITTQDTLSNYIIGNSFQRDVDNNITKSQDTQFERRTSARIKEKRARSVEQIIIPRTKAAESKRVVPTKKVKQDKKAGRQNQVALEKSQQQLSRIRPVVKNLFSDANNSEEVKDMELDLRIRAYLSVMKIESLTELLDNEFSEYKERSGLSNYGYVGKDQIIDEIMRFLNRRAIDLYFSLKSDTFYNRQR